MADIIYTYNGKPYLNLTNECPCACVFCIRTAHEGLGTAQSLWLGHSPTWQEVLAALEAFDFSPFGEAAFCGYGEPFCALENLTRSAAYLKSKYPGIHLRVNTNGLGDIINGCDAAAGLVGRIDTVSISLNAPNAERYEELVRPSYPEAYAAMLHFARRCIGRFPTVKMTAVDVISPQEMNQCRAICERMGAVFRERHYE
jgi:TatD family-associated radical SAM protein